MLCLFKELLKLLKMENCHGNVSLNSLILNANINLIYSTKQEKKKDETSRFDKIFRERFCFSMKCKILIVMA